MNKKKIILLGASLESDNRGVNALTIGAIFIIKKNIDCNISIITIGKEEKKSQVTIQDNITIPIYYYTKWQLFLSVLFSSFSLAATNLNKKIKESDLVFDLNEGDSYSDIYGIKRFLRHYLDTFICRKLIKRVIFLPQTIGPFNKSIVRFLAISQLKRLSALYVRDLKAVEFLKKNNINFKLFIDLAIHMPMKKIDFKVKQNTIGININGLMYFSNYSSMGKRYEKYYSFIETMLLKLLDLNYNILLIPHTYNIIKPNLEDDLAAIKDIYKKFNDKNIEVINSNLNAQELKYCISKCKFFIGSRMHSCIASLSSSVPTIGISYSYKFEGTFENFGMSDHILDFAEIDKNSIDWIIEKIKNRDNTKQLLDKTINKFLVPDLGFYA